VPLCNHIHLAWGFTSKLSAHWLCHKACPFTLPILSLIFVRQLSMPDSLSRSSVRRILSVARPYAAKASAESIPIQEIIYVLGAANIGAAFTGDFPSPASRRFQFLSGARKQPPHSPYRPRAAHRALLTPRVFSYPIPPPATYIVRAHLAHLDLGKTLTIRASDCTRGQHSISTLSGARIGVPRVLLFPSLMHLHKTSRPIR